MNGAQLTCHSAASRVAVIIPTLNEERNIHRTVLAAKTYFDNVFVVDSGSRDRTCELATDAGASVIQFKWNGSYPKKKQWCVDSVGVNLPWILFLDGDEVLTPELAHEVTRACAADAAEGFDVRLSYRFLGRELKYGHVVVKRILLLRAATEFADMGDKDAPGMGEQEGHYQPHVNGRVKRLKSPLSHADNDPLSSWFDRHNRYSSWESWVLGRREVRLTIRQSKSIQGRIFDLVPFKPVLFFAYCYIWKLGFLDGRPGLHYATALSFYRWQVVAKRFEMTQS